MSDEMKELKKRMNHDPRKSAPGAKKAAAPESRIEDEVRDLKQSGKGQKAVPSAVLAEHTVVSGDTLSGIAQKHYGSQANWKAIYEANKEVIGDNPNLIRVGQLLKIPKLA